MTGDELDRKIRNTYNQITFAARRAGTPTAQHNLRPKTTPVLYRDVHPGDVIMESTAHPVRVVSRTGIRVVKLKVLFVWQSDTEAPWPMGPYPGATVAAKAVTRRGARS